jgi:PAS domain S-box-containing protein
MSLLAVAALLAQRRRFDARLRSALADAQAATVSAGDASRVAELATRIADLGHTRLDFATGESVWSDQAYVIHGLDPANCDRPRRSKLDLYHPEDRAVIARCVEQARTTGQGYDIKARLTRASDGAARIVSYKGVVECDADGTPIALVGVLQDVTEAEMARRRIEESEAKYRLIADSAQDVILKFGPDGVHYISESIRRYGYAPEDLVGRSPLDFVHPDDVAKVEKVMADLLTSGAIDAAQDRTYRILTPAGDSVWMEGSPSLVRDPSGAVVGAITLLRDITEHRAVEVALAESEARYRQLTDSASDIILHYDATGIRYVSDACRRYGYAPEDLIGKPPRCLIHPEDVGKVAELHRELLSLGYMDPARDRTGRLLTASGEPFWVEGSPSIIRDAAGVPTGVINLIRDITDRIAAAQALADSEARYRLLAENSTDIIFCYGADAVATFASPTIETLLGFASHEVIGRETTDFIHPDDVKRLRKLFADYLEAGPGAAPIRFEYRSLRSDGSYVWLEAHPKAIYHPETGDFIEFQDTIRDISDRVAAAQALAESESRYRLLAENSTDVIGCYGADAVFTFMSPAIEAVLGYAPQDLVGQRTTKFMHPDDVTRVVKLFEAYLASGPGADPIQFEYRAIRRDGSAVWLEAHPKAIYDPATGAFVEFQDAVRDITARKALETDLREAMDQAEAATVAKSEFLSNMSHELRTPLTSIIGFAALLQDTPGLPGDAPRYVQRVATASGNLLSLVNDILDFSKLEAGQVSLEPAPVCPRDLVQELLELFEIQASAKGVKLNLVASENLPPGVSVDPTRVRQVMSNLIGNALKFTDRGSVTVGLTYSGSQLAVTVTDTGVGVPADRLDRLFKRFSQVDASTTRTHGGTGLGLAICQGLVEAMGGEIGVTSTVGEGSVFRFRIPAPSVDVATTAVEESAWAASLNGARVLVADDNQANRELARAILETQGVEIMEASDGKSAVELAMSLPFDLILMDIRMPVVDGLEATRRLRAEPGPNQDIPILAFSADGDLERLKGLTEVGFDGLAHKPIVPADLIAAISGCLQGALQDVERAHAL